MKIKIVIKAHVDWIAVTFKYMNFFQLQAYTEDVCNL